MKCTRCSANALETYCTACGVVVDDKTKTLIAAAPELLAALEAITEFTVNRYAGNGGEYLKEVKAARAAIAQAKGEASNDPH